MVDWDLAVTTAKRLMSPGPDINRDEARSVVEELRRCAAMAEGHVRAHTGLHAQSASAPVLVVDRAGWVQANADGFREVLRPLIAKMRERREPGSVATAIGSRVTGLEAGGLLAYLSNKVLGQFDPFYTGDDGAHGGRLLLVAPNVVQVERELEVDPHDFRLWVCVHEETHRVQFTAVPWLRNHLLGEIAGLISSTELDPNKLAAMMREGIDNVGKLVRGDSDVSLLDVVQTPEQKAVLERITASMSLLEGHADVVMDGVGPDVIPSVAAIRSKFTKRRAGAGPVDQMIRRLLGFDAKLRQYRDGAAFVRGVVDKVGMEGFNAVWDNATNLPGKDEIADPSLWVARVHG
ncbi:MAG: zinc-dependent metalloprotease [Propionibacteriales bacterium]|nr:zinc-dependent metalloprotease [Propionibacteriales bacterium]